MGKYGDAAVMATQLVKSRQESSPNQAWLVTMNNLFADSESSRKKSCPRDAYLGLCEAGKILGIPMGHYTRSIKNKKYALKALNLLREDPKLIYDGKGLWRKVVDYENKAHNHQMDVIISLLNEGLIKEM
jgi:hypothetical protein